MLASRASAHRVVAVNSAALRTRFAPSPTGYLHLGNARTALFNALYARQAGGVFVLRIEDTDVMRSRPEYAAAVEEDLRWLGLLWQEGPGVNGPVGPYCQSQRSAIYSRYFGELIARESAYPCFCSEAELAFARKQQLARGEPPRYPGTCSRLNADERKERLASGRPHTLRFAVPENAEVFFEDLVRSEQRFRTAEIGDFVIRRTDGSPAFFFSNAVDDALMEITHVLRGEDHLSNTPRQLLILEALGLRPPSYGHLALLVGAGGAPLSKRTGSRSVRELREAGLFPEAVTNYLARLGHVYDDDGYLALDRLAEHFNVQRLGRAPATFDEAQLRYWQGEALRNAPDERLGEWMGPAVKDIVPQDQRTDFVHVMRGNVHSPEESAAWASIIFTEIEDDTRDPNVQRVIDEAGAGFFREAARLYKENEGDFAAFTKALQRATGHRGRALFLPLRAALTGRLDGPELAQLISLISPELVRHRLERCVARCG